MRIPGGGNNGSRVALASGGDTMRPWGYPNYDIATAISLA